MLTASSVAMAIALGSMAEFDILVSDINLPDGQGWEILNALSARKRFPSIAATADCSNRAMATHIGKGFDLCIVKPFSVAELMARIESLLRRPRNIAEPAAAYKLN